MDRAIEILIVVYMHKLYSANISEAHRPTAKTTPNASMGDMFDDDDDNIITSIRREYQ